MIKRIRACPPEKKHAIFYCRLITVEPQLYKNGAVQACVLYSYPSRQNHLALPQQICSLSEYCSVVSSDMSIPNVGIHCYNVFCQVLFIITLIAQLDLCTALLNQVASAFAGENCLSPQSSATSSPLTSRVGPTLRQNCKRDFHPNSQSSTCTNMQHRLHNVSRFYSTNRPSPGTERNYSEKLDSVEPMLSAI